MSVGYNKIKKFPRTFNRLFGVQVDQFEEILKKTEPEWETKIIRRYKRPGRPFKCELADMILMLLLYYRSYTTQIFISYLFGIDDPSVCRIIRMLEPILAKIMAISKCKKLSREEIENLLVDATEQPIEKPGKGQKPYYSGKKKRHTLKTEIRTTIKGRIVHVSKSKPGSIHDFALFKQEPPLSPSSRAFLDSGYQGIEKIHPSSEIPYKASKNKPLDREDKEYNRALSRVHIKVENIIGDLKVFKILQDRYRNKRKCYNLKFNIIAGIVNMKNGFSPV